MNRIEDQEVGVKARGIVANKLEVILKDIQVKSGDGIKGSMIHAKIVDNNLVLEIDYETNERFAIVTYLQLAGYDLKVIVDEGLVDKVINNQNIP